MSIALTLEDELDISRGEMLAAAHQAPLVAANFSAALVWMDGQPLDPAKSYLLKHTSQTVKARVKDNPASGKHADPRSRAGRHA